MARSSTTEAVVLRSFRFGEADCVLHLYTRERGRLGAVAKGVRPTNAPVRRPLAPEAVVLRSFRSGEADGVLHLYPRERGRLGAVPKGVRRTKSRFGGRLE